MVTTSVPTFAGLEREARKYGFHGQFVSIEHDDFYVVCRWRAGEAAPVWSIDDVPTPAGQVYALLDNARRAAA